MMQIQLKGSNYEIGVQLAEILKVEQKKGYPPNYDEILEKSGA